MEIDEGRELGGFRVLHRPLGYLRSALVAASAVIPVIANLPVAKVATYVPAGVTIIKWSGTWLWLTVPLSVLLATFAGFLRRKIVDPEAADTLQDLLNHLHDLMFPLAIDERSRVTLFRFQRWQFKKWPLRPKRGGWLIAVKRSGDMHQDFSARFRVGDELTETCGIAGKAWCDVADAFVAGLPDVHNGNLTARAVKDYAKHTYISEQMVRDKKPRSRSFYAIKIRAKKKKWGVIVVDSEDTQLDREKIRQVFSHTQRFLAIYATRV